MASKLNYFPDFYKREILSGIVPELYINKDILTKGNIFKENIHKVYRINDYLFYEDDRSENVLQEFSLELKNQNEDNEDWSIEIKQNSFVVMVNSMVLLSCYQWNTITNEYPQKCLVCNMNVEDPKCHIEMGYHMTNLEKHKPLKKFNLHITRLIGDQYHCAVCNEVYEKNNNTHLDSERHLERMFYATNRATVGRYDFDSKNDNSSFNNDENDSDLKKDTVSTSESGFDSDGFYDFNNFINNKSTLQSYASVVKKSITKMPTSFIDHVIGNKTFMIASDTYHMILRPNGKNVFYCMLCIRFDDVSNTSDHCTSEEHMKKLKQCEICDIHAEHFIRKVTNKFYHCGTCNNLLLTGAVESHLELHERKQDNGTNDNSNEENVQHIKINEKSYQGNVQQIKINEKSYQGNVQQININENSHQGNAQQIKINENSHQGNVQQIKTNENSHQGNAQQIKTNENINKRNVVFECKPQPQTVRLNVFPTALTINNKNPNLLNDIIINRFNCNMRVSFMSYNIIFRRDVDFICLLCNFVSPDMTMHLKDARHIICLENVPFQPYFGVNLVRMLNQTAHCAICNVLVNASVIHLHTTSQAHLFFLNKAMNSNTYNTAMNQNNIVTIPSVNTKFTDVNNIGTSLNLQAIPTNNSETSNQASATKTTENPTELKEMELKETELDSDNLEYDKEDDMNVLKEFVYLKIKKTILKLSYASYNTLVHTGDGNRYCFICSHKITNSLRGHIKSKAHMNHMKKCRFITNYEKDLLRQVKLAYHCCICNVLVKKTEIKDHLIWPVHKENFNFVKLRRRPHKNIIYAEFQTKDTCFTEKEPQMQIVFKLITGKKASNNIGGMVVNIQPNKEHRGKILNVPWDAWQGITRYEHGVQCNICCDFFADIDSHLKEDNHTNLVSIPIEKQYLPACIRKITEKKLNCITCNMVFSNKERNISQHLVGKKHLGIYEDILQTAFSNVLFK